MIKKSLLAFILQLSIIGGFAQTPQRIIVNPASIVKDSMGNQYPFVIWQKLLANGNYTVTPVNPKQDDTEYLLVKFTAQEKALRISRMPKPLESTFFTTGETIKPFQVRDINGKRVNAKDWAGKTVVINFWFIGCQPCRAEIPELNKVAAKYSNNPNIIFIGIALDREYEIKDFIKMYPFNYQLVGDGSDYAKPFNIHLFPTNVVIDKQGKVRFHSSGYTRNTPFWIDKTIEDSGSAAL